MHAPGLGGHLPVSAEMFEGEAGQSVPGLGHDEADEATGDAVMPQGISGKSGADAADGTGKKTGLGQSRADPAAVESPPGTTSKAASTSQGRHHGGRKRRTPSPPPRDGAMLHTDEPQAASVAGADDIVRGNGHNERMMFDDRRGGTEASPVAVESACFSPAFHSVHDPQMEGILEQEFVGAGAARVAAGEVAVMQLDAAAAAARLQATLGRSTSPSNGRSVARVRFDYDV